MASMNSWCYFFLVEIIMAKQKTKNIMNRFLQGWQQIFGGDRQEAVQNKLKPFPQNHYFRPEELDYLSKNRSLTTIEKWAVATGKWAFEQSKDKFSDCKYASVKWQDGLMATWVDGRIIPDTPSRQAEKLALLKEEGFEIPDKYEKVITNYEASRLVGKYFHNGNDVVKVEDYDKGHLIGDTPKLVLRRWDKDNFMEKSEKMEYADFKNEIGKSFVVLNDTDIKKFEKYLNNVEQGKKQFAKVLNYIRESYPPVFGGTLPLEMQKVHEVKAFDGIDPRVYIKGDKRIGNGESVDVLPLREQRGQQTSETRFIDPLLLKAKTDGRWHTQEHMEKKVYKEYGSILAASKGLTVSDNGNESVPIDMSGHKYSGTTAMMLNIASRNHGYEVPVFLNLATMNANGIRVNENAVAIPVITKNGVENVYNIEQTDFPKKRPQEYSNMKLNQILESRLSLENKDAIESLVNNKRFTTKTSFDSSVGSASYSAIDNTIHVAPVGKYDKKDGFLQDLSEGLVMRTRKSEPVSSRFENILKEGLIVHLGSGLVGQKYGYDVGETAGSKFWKERLKNDPNYTKAVLKAAEKSSDKIIDYVDKLQKGQSQSSNLDMRSTTPIDIDVDGNGIVESDENLAPDKKQGADEEKDNNQEESHHQHHHFHR